jgi:hypothetical protein
MKTKVIEDEQRTPAPATWSELENALCETANMAFMLAATLEDCNDEEEKNSAIAFGIYQLLDYARAAKEIYNKLFDEVRQVKVEREEVVPLDDGDTERKKVVSLH